MTGLIDRLIFGTGHLVGGPDTRQARHLLELVRRAGVSRFDTAPLYGLGTAESVLGDVLGTDAGVTIATKVGLARPSWPLARAWARKGIRVLRGGGHGHADGPLAAAPGSGAAVAGQFDLAFMHRSLAGSVERLGRYPDVLLLHEYAAPAPDAEAFVQDLLLRGHVRQVGYAVGTPFDSSQDAAMPADWLVQAAVPPELLRGPVDLPDRPLAFHSLIGMGRWLVQTDPAYCLALAAVQRDVGDLAPAGEWAAVLPYCLAAAHAPQARLIFATAQAHRAAAFLDVLSAIDQAGALPAIHAIATRALAGGD